jgi:hypothetical protein
LYPGTYLVVLLREVLLNPTAALFVMSSFLPSASSSALPSKMVELPLDETDVLPLTVHVPDKQLLWRLPGALGSSSSSLSVGKSGKHHRHPKEHNVAYGVMSKCPAISKHISGLQTIRVQCTQQDPDLLNTSTTVPTYLGQLFTLAANVPNYAAYTAIFDEYKIDEVEVWITPNPVSSVAASTVRGLWSSAVDYDDANTPASISTVSDKQSNLTTTVDEAHYHKWTPKFAVGTYSGTFVSFGSSTGWLDCASPNVQHYGLKVAFSQTAGGIQFVSMTSRLTISFRGPGIS